MLYIRSAIEGEKQFLPFEFDEYEELSSILEPFVELTEMLSGSTYITLGLVLSGICNVEILLENIHCKYARNANVIKLLLADISERFQAFSDVHLAGIFFDVRLKFEDLPEYIPQSEAIERLENFLTPYLTDDILPNQIEVEPKKQAKLKILMFSGAAEC